MTYPMRVLHIITTINRGGAENHLYSLVEEQKKLGLDVSVAYLKGDGYWLERYRGLGVDVTNLEMKYYGDIFPLLRLRRLMVSLKPDIVHAHMPPAELYVRFALLMGSFSNKIPFIISKHNDEPFMKGHGANMLARWVAKRADHVIAISSAVKRYFVEQKIVKDHDITIVHYGINRAPYDDVKKEDVDRLRRTWSSQLEDIYIIGTVARLVPQKAIHILLNGFSLYRKDSSVPSKLVLVGSGPLEAELKKLSYDLGIEDDVVWAGSREDIPTVMKSFDVFALTSIYEGFGLVLLEAMCAQVPIVASGVSAIPEVVLDNITGILIPPEYPKLLAQSFKRLEDGALRSRYGTEGRRVASEQFTVDVMALATLSLYQQALGRD